MKNCNLCDATFDQNCQLERHIADDHQQEIDHDCEVCETSKVNDYTNIDSLPKKMFYKSHEDRTTKPT